MVKDRKNKDKRFQINSTSTQKPINFISNSFLIIGKPIFFISLFLIFCGVSAVLLIIKLLNTIGETTLSLGKVILKLRNRRVTRFAFLTIVIFVLSFWFYVWAIKDLPSPSQLATQPPKLTTQIFDRKGRLLYKFYKDEDRTLIKLSDVPTYVKNAIVAIEDKNFYQHAGLSLTGIVRAIQKNLTGSHLEGGSTITQQLVKNTLLSPEKSFRRKTRELILSIETELKFSKDQILEMYLNTVGFGGPAYGIQEASQQYFGKNVNQLTLAEGAMLAGLPQSPTKYSPFGIHSSDAKNRQKQVLQRMVEDHYISQIEANEAYKQELQIKTQKIEINAPHFVMYVKDLLASHFGEQTVLEGGLQVTTTLDLDVQSISQRAINDELSRLHGLNVTNAAAMVTNPSNGQILAMVGSKNFFDYTHDGQVNMTTALRQPGSSVKPINYALAFEKGLTPVSLIEDSPVSFHTSGAPAWTPRNYDGSFHGWVTARTALASSYNIPAVKLLAQNGVGQMASLGQAMGITTWNDPDRWGLSLTLGSVEVKMVDMTEVYGSFANSGLHVPLNPILSISDSRGNTLTFSPCETNQEAPGSIQVNADSSCTNQQVMRPETAYIVNDILSDNTARAPAFGQNSILNIPNRQVAVKTGTSNDLRDNWTFGYTPDILVATWVGNNDNSPMSNIASGITGASPIWNHIITQLLQKTNSTKFKIPGDLVKVQICAVTGTLTCSDCPYVKTESFVKGTEPKTSCTPEQIQNITLNKNKQQTATKSD